MNKRVLVCVGKSYGSDGRGVEPMYLEFTRPLMRLGCQVDHFDHCALSRSMGGVICGEKFVRLVTAGGFDLVLYQTAGRTWMPLEAIRDAGKCCPVVAWNSDDDWQWDDITSKQCSAFSYMVTTYRAIWEANREKFPNLLLSQWACLADYAEPWRRKDLPLSFVGYLYGSRLAEARALRKRAGLRLFGPGSRAARLGLSGVPGVWRIPALYGRSHTFQEVNDIWNRSRISWTPMSASKNGTILQIKSRTFEMGLSGTLMLCQRAPGMEEYYAEGKEYVGYSSLDECCDLVRFYLNNESARMALAHGYLRRTLGEHLWEHRIERLMSQVL